MLALAGLNLIAAILRPKTVRIVTALSKPCSIDLPTLSSMPHSSEADAQACVPAPCQRCCALSLPLPTNQSSCQLRAPQLSILRAPQVNARRYLWNHFHHWTGRIAIVLAIVNVYLGLHLSNVSPPCSSPAAQSSLHLRHCLVSGFICAAAAAAAAARSADSSHARLSLGFCSAAQRISGSMRPRTVSPHSPPRLPAHRRSWPSSSGATPSSWAR